MAHEGCVCNVLSDCDCTGSTIFEGHEGCTQYYLELIYSCVNEYFDEDYEYDQYKDANTNLCDPYKSSLIKTYTTSTYTIDKKNKIIYASSLNFLENLWNYYILENRLDEDSCGEDLEEKSTGDTIKAEDWDNIRKNLLKAKDDCYLNDKTGIVRIVNTDYDEEDDEYEVYLGNELDTDFLYSGIDEGDIIEAEHFYKIYLNILISSVHCRCNDNADIYCCYCDVVCQCNYSG